MTKQLTFDPAESLNIYFRVARVSSRKFVFTDENGDPYDISAISFELNVKKSPQISDDVLHLTIGDGLTISGAGNNELNVSVNDTDSDIPEAVYYWELYNDTSKETWIFGSAYFYKGSVGEFNSVNELTVNLSGDTVLITIHNSGITSIDGGTV